MSESTAAVLNTLKGDLPRRVAKPEGESIEGKLDPTADLAPHRLRPEDDDPDATKVMPAVEETEVLDAVAEQDEQPVEELRSPAEPTGHVFAYELAFDMRLAVQIGDRNGWITDGYFDAGTSQTNDSADLWPVNLYGALSIAVTESPFYTPGATHRHEVELVKFLGLGDARRGDVAPLFGWTIAGRAAADFRDALLGCADWLDPQPVEPEPQEADAGELEPPCPEECETEICDAEVVSES